MNLGRNSSQVALDFVVERGLDSKISNKWFVPAQKKSAHTVVILNDFLIADFFENLFTFVPCLSEIKSVGQF